MLMIIISILSQITVSTLLMSSLRKWKIYLVSHGLLFFLSIKQLCIYYCIVCCRGYHISSSKGSIRLIDLALCDSHSKLFEEPDAAGSKLFFTEIIASVSDIKFAKEGRYLLSRDYMTLKLWDINMDSGPVVTFQVHEHLKPKLCDLYENDSIFDKFECCISGDGLRAATSSYSNLFRVFGVSPGSTETATLGASRNPMSLNLSGKKDEIGKHETRQETYDGT
ncbi:serine/threonine protein phosphatase 2A 55 kDa regulatory subunit B alpha isoform isoform X2 [Brassica rapa]|nr:serine/threonine protein phosphatase 2A 55 kDa regulatory subunit B alpha isoform isoform X2 [Brassica rapa]